MKKLAISILLTIAISLFYAVPVFAYITAPTSYTIDGSSVGTKVFRNLAETGDFLVVFRYSLPYDSDNYSDTPASQSVMYRLFDTDGDTVLQGSNPYVNPYFGSNGYGDGVGSFYFPASSNMTWEAAYTIKLQGLPAYFNPSWDIGYTLTPDNFIASTTMQGCRDELASFILLACDWLASSYQDTGIVLKTSSDAGIVLSQYGEGYFRGAVPGLQALCPDLFFIQSLIPEKMAVSAYDLSLGATYTARLVGDDLGEGFTNLGTLLHTTGAVVESILVIGGTFLLCLWTSKKGWGIEIGLVGGALIAVGMAILVGDVVFTLVMILSLIAVIGLVWLTLLKKA